MIIDVVMLILFNRRVFSPSGSDHFNIHKIKYQFFSTLFVSSISKLPLFFPPSLPLFFSKDPDSYSSIHFIGGNLSILFPSIFLSGDSHVYSNGASSSSLFTRFLLRWFKFKRYWSYLSPRFKYILIPVHLIIIHFPLFNCSGVLKISRRFVFPLYFRSSSFEDVPSFKPFNSTGAASLLNRSTVFSFEWALTHRSFSRILPDSSNFPGAIPKFISKFDVRMNFHQSYSFSKIAFKIFSSLVHHFYSSLFRSASTILVVLVIILNMWRPKKCFL